MKHLTAYVERVNLTARIFAKAGSQLKEYHVHNLTAKDRDELLAKLEIELSPENLTCDGELRGARLRAKVAMFNGAKAELKNGGTYA